MSSSASPEKRGLYAGSFDPPTNGHLWMIEHGARIFDELHVAVAANPAKKGTFTTGERIELLEESCQDFENVTIGQFHGIYTVRYAKDNDYSFLLRGLRNGKDLDEEQALASFNRRIEPEIETVFLSCPDELLRVSSSAVKSMVGPEGWEAEIAPYVPDVVLTALSTNVANRGE